MVDTDNGMLFSLIKKKKKEENPAVCNNLDKPGGPYAKRSSETKKRNKYWMISLICGI